LNSLRIREKRLKNDKIQGFADEAAPLAEKIMPRRNQRPKQRF
jgi:hypothetical protein